MRTRMKRGRGQALILVLILLAIGSLIIVPLLQYGSTSYKSRAQYGQFIKEDYAADAANEYALWKLRWEPGFAPDLEFGVTSPPIVVTINGVTVSTTITAQASQLLSGYGLIDHQIKPTKEVTPTTALPNVPTTFTYTITLQRLEPNDAEFDPLQSIKDAMDKGFLYVPNSSSLDGVPFRDDDLTILQQPVIVSDVTQTQWSNISNEDAMVKQNAPTQNYGTSLTMDVSSGVLSQNNKARSFLKFDVSTLPAEAIINSATLTLWATSYPAVTRTYNANRVTGTWTQAGINWNNQPAVAALPTAKADTAAAITTPMAWNVVEDVRAWADGTAANNGWRISDEVEETATKPYTVTVRDTWEYDTDNGLTPDIIPISGDIYAVAYDGKDNDGFLKTVRINSNGLFTKTPIDTWEYDTDNGMTPDIIPISGNVYAVAYDGKDADGFLKTVTISSGGAITKTAIDTWEFDTANGQTPVIVPISGNVYAIAYNGVDDDGFLKTVTISSSGLITKTPIDTWEYDTFKAQAPDIIHISGNVYAIAYSGDGDDGFLKTVTISSSGLITKTAIDTLEFATVRGKFPDIIPVSGDVYAIAYQGSPSDTDACYLRTVNITSSGIIANTIIDAMEIEPKGKTPNIIPIATNVYAIASSGDKWNVRTVHITNDGNIIAKLTNTPVFDAGKGKTPAIIPISGDVYAIAYDGVDDDGFIKTVNLVAGSDVNYTTTFRTKEDDVQVTKEPKLVVNYTPLGGTQYQTVEWIFEPDLDFDYGELRTLSFQARAKPSDNTRYWNAARLLLNNSYTGMTAPVTVGTPPDTGIPGSGISVSKSADPFVVYAGIPTVVTYVISITNTDIGGFQKLDYVEDYLPPGFSYVVGSSIPPWDDENSTDNPAYPYNIGDFEPDKISDPSGRLMLKWHNKQSANGFFPGQGLLHDWPMPVGKTYTQTFQALAQVDVSGSYPNEVFVKLKDWNLYGDRGLGQDEMFYSWPTGEVIVPAYDILSETELVALRANAAITASGIAVRSWHWKRHK